ncbi:mCG144687, partial [Mus musculus]
LLFARRGINEFHRGIVTQAYHDPLISFIPLSHPPVLCPLLSLTAPFFIPQLAPTSASPVHTFWVPLPCLFHFSSDSLLPSQTLFLVSDLQIHCFCECVFLKELGATRLP